MTKIKLKPQAPKNDAAEEKAKELMPVQEKLEKADKIAKGGLIDDDEDEDDGSGEMLKLMQEIQNVRDTTKNLGDSERIVGLHVVGEHAAEIMQGFSLALRLGATKADLDATIGIHPSSGEEIVQVAITKRSGEDAGKAGC